MTFAEIDNLAEALAIIVPVSLFIIGWSIVKAVEHWARQKLSYHEPPFWTFGDYEETVTRTKRVPSEVEDG